MERLILTPTFVFLLVMHFALTGCGLGDGGIDGTGLQGTATTGTALRNTKVLVKGQNGQTVTTTTNATGKYSVDVKKLEPPYIIKTVSTKNNEFYSIAYEHGVTNIHPMTDLVLRYFFAKKNIDIEDAIKGNAALKFTLDKIDINVVAKSFEKLLKIAYKNYYVPENFNFFNSKFENDNINFNSLLSHLEVKIENDKINVTLFDESNKFKAIIVTDLDVSVDLTVTDFISPSTPIVVTPIAASESEIVVAWDSSKDNIGVAGYKVFRGSAKLPTEIVAVPVFRDNNLETLKQYCYEIQAFDGDGNESIRTTSSCVTTLDTDEETITPAAITDVVATALSDSRVELIWIPGAGNSILGYHIYRKNEGTFNQVATVIASRFIDEALNADTEYCYQVGAFDAAGNQGPIIGSYCARTQKAIAPDYDAPVTMTSPSSGIYNTVTNVRLVCTDNGGSGCKNTYYTINGINPDTDSFQYSTEISLRSNTTIKFFSTDNALNTEAIRIENYIVNLPEDLMPPNTKATPPGGNYDSLQVVVLGCNDVGSYGCDKTYFTLDDSTPTEASNIYTSPLLINNNITLRYFSVDYAGNVEPVIEETYNITVPAFYTLTVTSNDILGTITSDLTGIDCGSNCTTNYSLNSQILLTSTHPDNLKTLWTGCNTITDNQCSLKISDNTRVDVTFVPIFLENESNDTFAEADFIIGSHSIIGSFNKTDDADFYKFKTTEFGSLYAAISHDQVTSNIILYDGAKQQIGNSDSDKVHTLARSILPGTYYLKIESSSNEFDLINPYQLELSGSAIGGVSLDNFENNNSFNSATSITTIMHQGYFDTENDMDYYKINVSSAGTFRVTVSHQLVESYLSLYDSSESEISNSGRATAHTLTQSLLAGIYYVRVMSFANTYDLVTPYNLNFTGTVMGEDSPDDFEENDSFSTATLVSNEGIVQGYFDTQNDSDYYQIEVSATGTLQAKLSHNTVQSYLNLYGPNQQIIVSTVKGINHSLTQSLKPGTYYLKVISYSTAYDLFDPYNLELTGTVLGGTSPDANEENNSFSKATNVEAVGNIQGYFDTQNDADYYQFEITAGGKFNIKLSTERVYHNMYLYDSSQNQIAENLGQFETIDQLRVSSLTKTLTLGIYYFKVIPSQKLSGVVDPYDLVFTLN